MRPSVYRRYIIGGLFLFAAFCGFRASLGQSPLTVSRGNDSLERQPTGDDRIVFISDRDFNQEIYVMDSNGGHQTRLTNNPALDDAPAWSPDRSKIAYVTYQNPQFEIYVMDADGTNVINLTQSSDSERAPAWSPDGTKIAFGRNINIFGDELIYAMNSDGTNVIRLSSGPGQDTSPDWSPDGTKIAFVSSRDFAPQEIYVMDADGANQTNISHNPSRDNFPAWSPDGTKIAFDTDRDENYEIYVMDADGSNPVNLTNHPAVDQNPAWSPDGTKIVFQSNRSGESLEIYVMNADGSNPVRLTDNGDADFGADWGMPALGTPSPTPSATASISPSPTPSSTATPSPLELKNVSTRLRVETGDNALIAGLIITGSDPMNVVVRGIGPSLANAGIPDPLPDPTLELHDNSGALLLANDNWQDEPNASQLVALGLAPNNPLESALMTTLAPAAYTTIVAGKNGESGVGLAEVYNTTGLTSGPTFNSELGNISTRGLVQTGNNVMIAGFILNGGPNQSATIARGIGPSLSQFGVPNPLADPTLELHDINGTLIANDNWQDDPTSAAQLTGHGLAPQNPLESGIYMSLQPGLYTAILAGKNGGTGVGLVEIYNLR